VLCNHHYHPCPEFFSSYRLEALYLLNTNSSFSSSSSGNHHSFCLCGCDYTRDFISVKSWNICLFVTGLFHLHNVLKFHSCCRTVENFFPF
jgi:hypothetical protein